MIKKILLGIGVTLVLAVAGFAGVVAMQPAEYRVERKASIEAPPEVVFAQVNDFHNWEAWSPWAKLDPNAKMTFEGPSGVGAGYAWAGNDEIGEGRMTILESKPGELVKIKLDFIKPFAATCSTVFTFKAEGGKTVVTWTMSGENNFIGKGFHLFMDCDKMIGGDFEKGLARMKEVSEAKSQRASAE